MQKATLIWDVQTMDEVPEDELNEDGALVDDARVQLREVREESAGPYEYLELILPDTSPPTVIEFTRRIESDETPEQADANERPWMTTGRSGYEAVVEFHKEV